MTLNNKVALVTGASGGIGRAICQQLAERGAILVAHSHSQPEKAAKLLDELASKNRRHHLLQADISDPAAVETLIERTTELASRLDIVVNNAGVFERHPPLEVDYDAWQQHWRRTLSINLEGPANIAYCAARVMARQGDGGRIINVGSRGAFRGEPDTPAYGASKAGLHALSQSLALAFARHQISVFAVAPGFVETAMARPYLTGEMAEAIRRQSPLGRVATADDVAYWVACLAEPAAAFATGTIIDVNGASYLRT